MTNWSGCTKLVVSLLIVYCAFAAPKKSTGAELFVFEAKYKVVTESDLSAKQFDDAFKPILTARERIEVIALESIRLADQNEGDEEMQELKLRGRGLLQSGDVPSGSAAAAAASLNPGASMQGTGKKPNVVEPDQVTLAPGQSIQERIGFGLQRPSSSNSQGSPGPSLWSASVAAAQARGESASLYAPPMQTPQAAKLYTGFGLEQEPAQARPLADSFLQIDRIEFPAPAAAPDGAEVSVRTLKQGDGEAPPHYWDSPQGADLAAEAPSLDWGLPQSSAVGASPMAMPAAGGPKAAPHYWDSAQGADLAAEAPSLDWGLPESSAVGASPAAMPAGGTPKAAPHYWDATEPVSMGAPSPSPVDVPQGSNPQIYEHRWRMPNQAVGRLPDDGIFPTQVYTASIPALTLEHADISDPSSVPVRLNARNGRVQAASVQGALAAASADSSSGEPGAGAPASSRRLHVWQAGEEVKDDAWAREGWDGDIQAAKAAEAEQGKAQAENASDKGKDASKEGEVEKGDEDKSDKGSASDSKVADTDQKVLISQSADSAPAQTGSARDALQDIVILASEQPQKKQAPTQQQRRKIKQPGSKAGSRAANAGSSASSARVSAEVGQPGKRDRQAEQAGAIGKSAGSHQQGPGRGAVRQKERGAGAMQRTDSGGLRTKAAADVMQPAKSGAGKAAGGAAAAQQLSQQDLKSVTSLLSMIRENAGAKNGMGQLFKPKAMDYIHRAIVQAIADAKAEAAPCKQPPREELPQDLVEMLTGYKQVPRTKEEDDEWQNQDTSRREYTVTFRVTTPEAKFGELLSNVNVLRITKENLQKKHVQVISVTDDELVRVMKDGSRWVMSADKQQKQGVVSNKEQQPSSQGNDQQQKEGRSNTQQQKRGSRRLLQGMLSALPDEALPARLVSAIKAAAGFIRLRTL